MERKEVASSGRGGTCGHATKGTAKGVEEESSTCPMTEDAGALWRGHPRWGMPIRVPDGACLLELGWYMKEVIVLYVECGRCRQK